MSGLDEVDCSGCGRRHVTNGEQARKLRVLRCECGHFVRLDRALAERRSERAAAAPIEIASARADEHEEEDDATHMLSSLSAVAAMSGRGRNRSAQPSLVDDDRVSRPVPRADALRSLPSASGPAPARQRQSSIAPSDKPLWYVDLGGTELVEMTIEQLILARRSGKLGEGALVWREGMPSWRPVGTLIPAASASSHPSPLSTPSPAPAPSRPSVPVPAVIRTPLPGGATRTPLPQLTRTPFPGGNTPAAKRTPPPPSPADEPTPKSLGSYERPLATLEFAFERPERTPFIAATRASLPSIDSSAAPGPPPRTPVPRGSLSSPFGAPFPRPAALPSLGSPATPFPSPRLSPPPPPPATVSPSPIPAAPAAQPSELPDQAAQASLHTPHAWSERPRWLSACIALVVCATASAAGASLVRSLKQHRRPPALAASVSPAPLVSAAVPSQPSTPPAVASAPLVVDIESLSVEHKRTVPRAVRATPKLTPAEPAASSDETPTQAAESAPESALQSAPKDGDLPAAARSNPYGSGSLIDQIKRATADEEAGQ